MATMKDKAFLAEAEKADLEITPLDGAAVQKIIEDSAKTSPTILKNTAAMLRVESEIENQVAPAISRNGRQAATDGGNTALLSGSPRPVACPAPWPGP